MSYLGPIFFKFYFSVVGAVIVLFFSRNKTDLKLDKILNKLICN